MVTEAGNRVAGRIDVVLMWLRVTRLIEILHLLVSLIGDWTAVALMLLSVVRLVGNEHLRLAPIVGRTRNLHTL